MGTPRGAEGVGVENPPGKVIAGKPVPWESTPFRSNWSSPIVATRRRERGCPVRC